VKISSTGKGLDRWTYWAESSYRSSAQLNGLVIDPAGELYVTDGVGETVQKFSSRKQPLLRWGAPGSDVGDFNDPMGLALDSRGDVFVVDPLNARVQEFSSSGRFLRAWGTEGSGPGQFSDPNGIAVDAQGNVYVTDTLNNRIQKFSP
jgi:DNA-binding beta-propeller fold protein YncE